jgi:hypothetical protein
MTKQDRRTTEFICSSVLVCDFLFLNPDLFVNFDQAWYRCRLSDSRITVPLPFEHANQPKDSYDVCHRRHLYRGSSLPEQFL